MASSPGSTHSHLEVQQLPVWASGSETGSTLPQPWDITSWQHSAGCLSWLSMPHPGGSCWISPRATASPDHCLKCQHCPSACECISLADTSCLPANRENKPQAVLLNEIIQYLHCSSQITKLQQMLQQGSNSTDPTSNAVSGQLSLWPGTKAGTDIDASH